MKLTKQSIAHIAELARLKLSDKELATYGDQLSGILSYIDQLSEVDTDNVEPTAQVTGLKNVLRDDDIFIWDESETKEALDEAPEMEQGQVKVKRIIWD